MPKRRPADDRGGRSRAAKASKTPRRHLYLVLDDWKQGYSIRKLDLSSDGSESDDGRTTEQRRLPPAVFRLEAPHMQSGLFATFGSKIVATHRTPRRAMLMWDVSTRALTFGPRHKYHINSFANVYAEVNGHLFLLDNNTFEVLEPPPPPPEDLQPCERVVWKWQRLPEPPLAHYVFSPAVQPDEQTIFFSTEDKDYRRTEVATFSFDTESRKWTCHGEWRRPFKGRVCFDPELEAWVGLSNDLGRLCACELVSAAAGAVEHPPAVKLSKEKLFCVDPAEKYIGATVVQVGSRSQYCLVQSFYVNDPQQEIWMECLREDIIRCQYMLRFTTFFLKYDSNGDLRSVVDGKVRSYRLPKAGYDDDYLEQPMAFWM